MPQSNDLPEEVWKDCAQCTQPGVVGQSIASFKCPLCLQDGKSVEESTFYVCNRECQSKFYKRHKLYTHSTDGVSAAQSVRDAVKAQHKGKKIETNHVNHETGEDNTTGGKSVDPMELLQCMNDPGSWLNSVKKDHEEWFVDCYRMRCHDDHHWGAGNDHGIFIPDNKAQELVGDFLVFVKLAVKNKMLPVSEKFSFKKLLTEVAPALLLYLFEKEDAKKKYGGENVSQL